MFVHIGFGNYLNSDQIVAVCRADSAPMKRTVTAAREQGILVDATQGRKTKTVITAMNGQVILSALLPETIAARCSMEFTCASAAKEEEEREDESREEPAEG